MNRGHLAATARLAVTLIVVSTVASSALAKKTKPVEPQSEKTPPRREKSQPFLDRVDDEIAGQGYGMAGCGLGSVILGERKGMVQIFAATLNGTSGNQTFGMTSGTSNCDSYKDMASIQFIDSNRYSIENDAARGGGETLQSLAQIMNCEISGAKMQSRYPEIFQTSRDARSIYFSIRHNLNCRG